MQQVAGQDGVYRIGAAEALFKVRAQSLDGAVPPYPGAADASHVYGFISRGLALPGTGGFYVVECRDADTVRVVAYVDFYGRAFSTSEALSVPPARQPDLSFARYESHPDTPGEQRGCVYVHNDGSTCEVAQYRCVRNRYSLFDSWYDFGHHATNLSYEEVMTRAYLAFVHRPSLGAPRVPARGLECVFERLHSDKPLAGMRALVADVRRAEDDPVFLVPALVRCLARWLRDAGLDDAQVRDAGDEALRLVRTMRYAKTYYVALDDEKTVLSWRTAWALEAALNRFLLVSEALGESATAATEDDCARWDAYLIETVAMQHPALGQLADAPQGPHGGEWEVRCALASAIERLRLPIRIDASLRLDVAAGTVAFDVAVPDGALMPSRVGDEGSAAADGVPPSAEEREAQARRYALHIGLVLGALAFEASSCVTRVDLVAHPFADGKDAARRSEGGEFPAEAKPSAYVQVTFDRETFERFDGFAQARATDPLPPYQTCGARFDVVDAVAYECMDDLASSARRRELPETRSQMLAQPAHEALGTDESAGMRISYDAAYRRMAEGLADRIVRAAGASEAIRIVRAAQDEARAARDDRAVSSCTRLMAALAEGALDMGDQNAVVGRYLGDDRCLVALGRAKAVAERDAGKAVDILIDAVAEAAALDGFVDGANTVYRTFDSYAARMLYNRAQRAGEGFPQRAAADKGKHVRLAPDTFYLCHLEIVRLLEHSFERVDEALHYGQRAVEIAPATAAGYRQLGRAYMLVGDMDHVADILQEGLRIAVQPSDIAMAYYQLAYVLWKMGRAQEGAVCYLKSLATSPMVAIQATTELQELVAEAGASVPPRDQVDVELVRAGVPVAPSSAVLEALGMGACAALDADLFPVARNLLAVRLRYRPDDALVNVLRSLED